ncbi:MAG: rhodanese-like domain-containing protein [Pseudomonadota bacterium]
MNIVIERQDSLVDEAAPRDAWAQLADDCGAVLIDVRSHPEWAFAGRPKLSAIGRWLLSVEWQIWPGMAPNLGFLSDLEERLHGAIPRRVFFLCRSGPRSVEAARTFSQQMRARGVGLHYSNILNGFEGDRDANGQRGRLNGWKAAGLPWTQD